MMMAVPPAIILAQYDPAAGRDAIGALGLYLAVYLFMNLGAFAVVAFLRNHLGSEEIADYAGLIRRCPGVVVCFTAILFSLVGLPPLAGFLGKFAIFAALVDGYRATAAAGVAANYLIVLLIVGGVNTAISLFYYLRVVKVMTIDPEPATRVPVNFPLVSLSGAYLALITAPILLLIVSWNWIYDLARAAAQQLM
jgi:NADH-quinone oxidoreductase subunit N